MIDISSLKKGTRILLETSETVFEIEIVSGKSSSVIFSGGTVNVYPCKAQITTPLIKNGDVKFIFKKRGEQQQLVVSKNILSAVVFSEDEKWKYEAIQRDKNENNYTA